MVIDLINNIAFFSLKVTLVSAAILFVVARSRNTPASVIHCVLFVCISSAVLIPVLDFFIPHIPFEIIPKSLSGLMAYAPYRIDEGVLAYRWLSVVCFILYLFVAAMILAYRFIGIFSTWQLTKNATSYHGADECIATLVGELGVHKTVRVVTSSAITGAQTWGHFKPVVLLPENVDSWPKTRLQRVLVHELSHIARSDWLLKNSAYCIVAFVWFIPVLWSLVRRMEWFAELACDDAVVSRDNDRVGYAEDLLTIAADMKLAEAALSNRSQPALKGGQSGAVVNMLDVSTHYQRIEAVLDGTKIREPLKKRKLIFVLAMAVVLLSPVVSLKAVVMANNAVYQHSVAYPLALLELKNTEFEESGKRNKDAEELGGDEANATTLWDVVMAQKPGAVDATPVMEVMLVLANGNRRLLERNVKPQAENALADLQLEAEVMRLDDLVLPANKMNPRVTISGLNPVYTVVPEYPKKALSRGQEGHVSVMFDVLADGSVGRLKVVEASPRHVFDKTVLQAVSAFKFKPIKLNGEAVVLENIREDFTFQIVDE